MNFLCRGLFQQVYLKKLLAKSDAEVEVEAVTLCSMYQMSKVLDSSLDGRQLRYYDSETKNILPLIFQLLS